MVYHCIHVLVPNVDMLNDDRLISGNLLITVVFDGMAATLLRPAVLIEGIVILLLCISIY